MTRKQALLQNFKSKSNISIGLTTHEVSQLINVTPTTIIDWIKKGHIKCSRTIGGHRRIPLNEVEKLIEKMSGSKQDSKPEFIDNPIENNSIEDKQKVTTEQIKTDKQKVEQKTEHKKTNNKTSNKISNKKK